MNGQTSKAAALLAGLLLAFAGSAQESSDTGDAAAESEAQSGETSMTEEDAAVEEVLSDTDDIVYREDEGSEDFIPSQEVSADQSIDYPIDI